MLTIPVGVISISFQLVLYHSDTFTISSTLAFTSFNCLVAFWTLPNSFLVALFQSIPHWLHNSSKIKSLFLAFVLLVFVLLVIVRSSLRLTEVSSLILLPLLALILYGTVFNVYRLLWLAPFSLGGLFVICIALIDTNSFNPLSTELTWQLISLAKVFLLGKHLFVLRSAYFHNAPYKTFDLSDISDNKIHSGIITNLLSISNWSIFPAPFLIMG